MSGICNSITRLLLVNISLLTFSAPICHAGGFTIDVFDWHIDKNGNAIIDLVSAPQSSSLDLCIFTFDVYSCALVITDYQGNNVPLLRRSWNMSRAEAADFLNGLRNYKIPGITANEKTRLCPTYIGYDKEGGWMWEPPYGNACSGGGKGPTPPKPPLSCRADDIEINHGTASQASVNGNRKTSGLRISCSGDATIHLYSASYSAKEGLILSTDKALRSYLTVDGSDISKGKTLKISSSPTRVDIISTLASSGVVKEGIYRGSLVINIDIQ